MIYRFFDYLSGNVQVRVTGPFVERFINLLGKKGIRVWDIAKISPTQVTFFLPKNQFQKLRRPAKNTNVRVKILQKQGAPFVYDKYKKRYALLCGVLVFFVALLLLSQFLWAIDITGNEKLESGYVADQLAALGVKRGAWKRSLPLEDIINQLSMDIPELAFISINFKGTRAEVQIKERVPKPLDRNPLIPRDILSKSDGQIVDIEVYEGEAKVQRGDTVQKGDVLVSGVVPLRDENYYLVSGDAKVTAHVWKSGAIEASRVATSKIEGNREIRRFSLNIAGFEIKLFLNTRISIPTYDRIEEVNAFALPFGLDLPIFVRKETYKEYFVLSRVQEDFELEALCKAKLSEYAHSLSLLETYSITEDLQITEGGATLKFVIDGLMDIVEYKEIIE